MFVSILSKIAEVSPMNSPTNEELWEFFQNRITPQIRDYQTVPQEASGNNSNGEDPREVIAQLAENMIAVISLMEKDKV